MGQTVGNLIVLGPVIALAAMGYKKGLFYSLTIFLMVTVSAFAGS